MKRGNAGVVLVWVGLLGGCRWACVWERDAGRPFGFLDRWRGRVRSLHDVAAITNGLRSSREGGFVSKGGEERRGFLRGGRGGGPRSETASYDLWSRVPTPPPPPASFGIPPPWSFSFPCLGDQRAFLSLSVPSMAGLDLPSCLPC